MSSIFLFIHWNSSCQSTQFIIVLFGCFRYGSYSLIVRLSRHSAHWTMDIRFKIMTNIVERFLINNWMCLFIEHGDLMDVSNQNVLNQKRFKKVYISDVCCCCKKKQLDGHHVDATYAFTKCAGYHQACAQCPVWLVISSVVKQLLYKFSIQDFFFRFLFATIHKLITRLNGFLLVLWFILLATALIWYVFNIGKLSTSTWHIQNTNEHI